MLRLTEGVFSKVDFQIGLEGETVSESINTPSSQLLETIYFSNGKHDISEAQIENIGKKLAAYIKKADVYIRVSGHTDNAPLINPVSVEKYGDNYGLSKYRAQIIGQEIQRRLGLTKDKIEYVGYGPDKPIADNASEQGQQKNRRVEIEIILTGEAKQTQSAQDCIDKNKPQTVTFNPVTPSRKLKSVTLKDAFFENNSVVVKNVATLVKLHKILKNNPGVSVVIHSDNTALKIARVRVLQDLLGHDVEVEPSN